ncbi:MAG: chromate transporter [Bacteroidales bacterium]|nr:chromate transporter [Bacteroidales bacterium]
MNKELFLTFMKIGGFTLGGGAAMVPMMEKEIVQKRQWLSKEEFLDVYAVSQATPGIFAVDMASHIGYKLGGVKSGIVAALGVVAPSIVIILAIAIVFSQFKDNPWVEAFFMGVRPAVVAILAIPIFSMAKSAKVTWSNCWIPISSTLLIWLLGVSPAWIILIAGLCGFCYGWILNRGKSRE